MDSIYEEITFRGTILRVIGHMLMLQLVSFDRQQRRGSGNHDDQGHQEGDAQHVFLFHHFR